MGWIGNLWLTLHITCCRVQCDVATLSSNLSLTHLFSEPEHKNTLNDVEDDPLQANFSDIFMLPRKAKTFLRVRRLWWLWGESAEEESERSRERNEENYERAYKIAACKKNCWGSWSSWSSCSRRCGSSGTKRRTRKISTSCSSYISQSQCSGSSSDTASCGRYCYNGGYLMSTYCSCRSGYRGECCEDSMCHFFIVIVLQCWQLLGVRCGSPGSTSNGYYSPSRSSYYYDEYITYYCNTGYTLIGSSARRTCTGSSGYWSGSTPTCRSKLPCESWAN